MDMTESLAAKSDQLNATDLLAGPRTFTIEKVTQGSPEQPFDFHLVENPGHPYRPSKGMRRVIARGWGPKAEAYTGRRFTLYCDPTVKWAGAPVGGIKVSHMSDVGDGFTAPLAESKTKRAMHRVDPLPDATPATPAQPQPSVEDVAACTDPEALKVMWRRSGPERRAQIEARVAELNATD